MDSPAKKQLTAEQWFGRADEFWAASAVLGKDREGLLNASVVCGAFAMEAYLKCLLTLRDRRFPGDHNLQRLFKLLPLADRKQIEEDWNIDCLPHLLASQAKAPKAFGGHLPKTLNQALKRGGDAFKDWRYNSTGVRYFTLGRFGMHVRDAIIRIHPDWRADPPDPFGKRSKDRDLNSGPPVAQASVRAAGIQWREVSPGPVEGFRRK